jgi:hypothetical protein
MKTFITSQDIILHVINHASANAIYLGEFKEIMNNMLAMNNYEYRLYEHMEKILVQDLSALHTKKIQQMVSDVPCCLVELLYL